jgi:hypothetical protein
MSTLIFMLAAMVALAAVGGLFLRWSCVYDSVLLAVVGVLSCLFSAIGILVLAMGAYSWTASGYRTEIINREYGSSYTREEIFFASGVIETVRELNRQRIEVNGDIMRGPKP